MDPTRVYLICATQRSGSTLLCELLKDTSVAGRPEEYFEACYDTGVPPHPSRFLDGLPLTGTGVRSDSTPPDAPGYSSLAGLAGYDAHLSRTFSLGTTANGVFGAKLMFNQIPELHRLAGTLERYAGLSEVELIRSLFDDPVCVFVSRADKVRQAVSMWKALQNRRWRGEGADLRPAGPRSTGQAPRYSYAGIHHLVCRFESDERGWRAIFEQLAIEPLVVGYERDLESDRAGTVRAVLSRLGVAPPAGWVAPEPLPRQADALSEEWVAAYHRDHARATPPAGGAAGDIA